jgi:hypothetical protein
MLFVVRASEEDRVLERDRASGQIRSGRSRASVDRAVLSGRASEHDMLFVVRASEEDRVLERDRASEQIRSGRSRASVDRASEQN